jgi:hypothetical protein
MRLSKACERQVFEATNSHDLELTGNAIHEVIDTQRNVTKGRHSTARICLYGGGLLHKMMLSHPVS